MLRIATAPTTWTRYSPQLLAYVAEIIPSESCRQKRMMINVGTDRIHALKVLTQIPLATTSNA